jgi:hypothetical protein
MCAHGCSSSTTADITSLLCVATTRFHHATVLLYCWHSFTVRSATGIWFIAMNYFVHSIMYSYYFLMIIGQKYLAKLIAQHITSLQILQVSSRGRWTL